MSEQPQTEQIPHQFVIDELQAQLNARTSDLVVANSRIRARDEQISRLQADLHEARTQLTRELNVSGPAV